MSKHSELANQLQSGKTITYREYGNSMLPKLKSGVLVTIEPYETNKLEIGDIVLCKVKGKYYLHYIKSIDNKKGFLIGNAHGHLNGWTRNVYGKLIDYVNN